MNFNPNTLLVLSLCGYAGGAAVGLLFMRRERIATVLSFGAATLAGLAGVASAIRPLLGTANVAPRISLLYSSIPEFQLTVRIDPLGAFFLLIVSMLGFALSAYSLGYARGF